MSDLMDWLANGPAAPLIGELRERGVEFRTPELLLGLGLLPFLLLVYALAVRQRRRVALAFQVTRPGAPRSRPHRFWRALALLVTLCGTAGLIVAFARPVTPLPSAQDRATVVFVVDASVAMRATDVNPTRFEAAKAQARDAIKAMPDRMQVAVVGYSQGAYVVLAPTHDHGAAAPALNRVRTADGAALGDAIAVALATIPRQGADDGASQPGGAAVPGGSGGAGGAGGAAGGGQDQAPRVPSVIVVLASGELNAGRAIEEAAAAVRDARVPVFVVPVGPRRPEDLKAPFEPQLLAQVAQFSGGRALTSPNGRDWRRIFDALGQDVSVKVRPQEVGHVLGAAALGVMATGMLVSLIAARRLL